MPERPVRLGITLPQFTDDPERLMGAATRAEEAGLDSIWLFDHLWPLFGGKTRPILEQWTTLTFLAERTTRIGIGTLVTRSTLRRLPLLAKMAATVAEIAPGRVTVSLGSGDAMNADENVSFGLPVWSRDDRYEQLGSAAAFLDGFFAGETVSRDDRFVTVDRLPVSPRPRPRPRLWVAGLSRPIARLAGRAADGWNAWGLSPRAFGERGAEVIEAAQGRSVELTWAGLVQLEASDDAAATAAAGKQRDVVGGPETVAAHLRELVDAGATHFIVSFPNASAPGVIERLATEVRERLA